MKIVIDFRVTYKNDTALSVFTNGFWQDMVLLHPGHEFIFLPGERKAPDPPAKNVHIRKLKRINIKWFDQKKLDKALAAWGADYLVTIPGNGFRIHPLREKKIKNGTARADQLVVFAGHTAIPAPGKAMPMPVITVIKPACRTVINSLTWTEAESIKTQYTGGRAFFLFTGNISEQHQLIDLLKAFSVFKKWQQSNMQLVIAGYETAWTQVFEEKLLTYKYRTDVIILKNVNGAETAKLVAASYAILYPVAADVFPLGLLWGVQSNKAVIASDNYSNRQITPAAEWVDKNNTAEGFAKAMILLYRDEKHLQLLVQQTTGPSRQLNRGQMLAEVWQCIEE